MNVVASKKTAPSEAKLAEKKARFTRVSETRVNRILHDIRVLQKCSQTATYSYTKKQADRMFNKIRKAIDEAEKAFYLELSGKKRFSLKEDAESEMSFNDILGVLPKAPKKGIWTDGTEILCGDEVTANAVANFLEAMGVADTICTGYYDPVEDRAAATVDSLTGWHYIDC